MYEAELDLGDILLTYKMELFVTICLLKVTFCRLMISYIQYCPMSIFSCVSLLLVPFRCRWFHLKTSEMVLFVTIAIPNAVFYWAMVLHAVSYYEFLVFLCQFVVESISLKAAPSCFRWFQVVPAHSRWFQLVAGGSSSLQVVPDRSSGSFSLFLVVPAHSLF